MSSPATSSTLSFNSLDLQRPPERPGSREADVFEILAYLDLTPLKHHSQADMQISPPILRFESLLSEIRSIMSTMNKGKKECQLEENSEITTDLLVKEIESVLIHPQFTERTSQLMDSLLLANPEEFSQLESDLIKGFRVDSPRTIIAEKIAVFLIIKIKNIKMDLKKVSEAISFFKSGEYENAYALLDSIDDPMFISGIQKIYQKLARYLDSIGLLETAEELRVKAQGCAKKANPSEFVRRKVRKSLKYLKGSYRVVKGTTVPVQDNK